MWRCKIVHRQWQWEHECMKMITIREETYEKLSSLKEPGDSYSDIIDSLLKRKEMDLKKYCGCLKESKVIDDIEAFSTESRRNTRMRIWHSLIPPFSSIILGEGSVSDTLSKTIPMWPPPQNHQFCTVPAVSFIPDEKFILPGEILMMSTLNVWGCKF